MILNAIADKLKRQSRHDFKGRHFEAADRAGVAWYLRYPLSYRDIEEMFRERGFEVDHSTISLGLGLCTYHGEAVASISPTPLWFGPDRRNLRQDSW